MAVMTVYHGGYMPVEHLEIRKGRNTKDFGTGFYCTVIKEQAQRWAKRYDLADVYHSDNIEQVSDDFIREAYIKQGNFDNVCEFEYAIPSHWDIGKVYKRLIKSVASEKNISVVDALMEVYHSFISDKIDDYNSSVYYENPSYIFECFMQDKIL